VPFEQSQNLSLKGLCHNIYYYSRKYKDYEEAKWLVGKNDGSLAEIEIPLTAQLEEEHEVPNQHNRWQPRTTTQLAEYASDELREAIVWFQALMLLIGWSGLSP
jgi:hypothetical protein